MQKILLALLLLVGTGQVADAAAAPRVPSADGVPIAYEVHGKGSPALVLIHCWCCDRGYWKEQVDALSAQYQLVLVDLAGHGESGLGRKDYTMASFGADVAAVVDSLGLEQVVLVGHSMGSDVAVEAAKLLRGKVTGMVWIDQHTSLDESITDEQIESFLAGFRKDFRGATNSFIRGMFLPGSDPKLVERVAKDMSSAPPAVGLSAMANNLRSFGNLTAALDELKLPVVAINADRRPTDHASLAKHGVKAFVIPDSDHFVLLEDPVRFNRSLEVVVRGFAQ